jgi:hypothetical protein
MIVMTIDHDRLFKELISTFFLEFVDLFLPQIAVDIDRDSIHFLPQWVRGYLLGLECIRRASLLSCGRYNRVKQQGGIYGDCNKLGTKSS